MLPFIRTTVFIYFIYCILQYTYSTVQYYSTVSVALLSAAVVQVAAAAAGSHLFAAAQLLIATAAVDSQAAPFCCGLY